MEIIYKDYLDFSLQKLSEKFSEGLILSELRNEYNEKYGIWIEDNDQKHFESYYEGKLFERIGNTYKHRILSDAQTIIKTHGSFAAYLELIELEKTKKEDEENELKKLQKINFELQNESLLYQKTIREKDEIIRDLEIKLKGIELLKSYWWVIGLCIFVGGILKEPLEMLLTYMKQLIQSMQI